MNKPANVRRAQITANTEAIKALGSAGGHATAEKRRLEAAIREVEEERTKEMLEDEERFRLEQSGEDILPPNIHK